MFRQFPHSVRELLARIHCDEAFSVGPVGELSDKLKVGTWCQVGEVISYQKGSWTKTGFQLSANAGMNLTNALAEKLPVLFQNLERIKVASGEILSLPTITARNFAKRPERMWWI